jgi:hypothetical protein
MLADSLDVQSNRVQGVIRKNERKGDDPSTVAI